MRKIFKQYGLSMVELLIALALSTVLVTALYRIVMANQQGVAIVDSYSKIQDTSRTVFDLMQYDLRMAGFRGCVMNKENINVRLNTTADGSNGYYSVIHNFSETAQLIASPADFAPTDIDIDNNSSSLVLRKAISIDALVASSTVANMQVVGPKSQLANLREGDVLMVSDCEDADVFALKAIDVDITPAVVTFGQNIVGGPSNTDGTLSKLYPSGSQIVLMHTINYFVAPSRLLEGETTGINSLYSFDSLDGDGAVSKELVPYVDKMTLAFLVEEGSNRVYKSSVTSADNIFAIRVTLEMATEKTCGKPKAHDDNCIEPQEYERVFFIRNSRSEI